MDKLNFLPVLAYQHLSHGQSISETNQCILMGNNKENTFLCAHDNGEHFTVYVFAVFCN